MIKPFLEDINSKIKSRTKEEWILFAQQKLNAYRAYIQDNGEIGFVAAFLLGIFVVVFFRLAFALFFIGALLAAMIWCLAESDIERKSSVKDPELVKKESVKKDPANKENENDDVDSRLH